MATLAKFFRDLNRYVIVALVVLLAFFVRFVLGEVLGDTAAALVFVPAMLFSSLLGGVGPGLFAAMLALPLTWFFLWPVVPLPHAAAYLVLLALIGVGIAFMGQSLTRSLAEAKLAAKHLRRREAHLRSVLDTSPDATVVISADGTIVTYNAAAARQFGYLESEAIGANVSTLMPEYSRVRYEGSIARYLEAGLSRADEIERIAAGRRKDGSTFPMRLAIGRMVVEGETFFTGFVQDLTEQQRAAELLDAARSELTHLARVHELGEMASILAHELNQPLSAIINYVEGCQRLLLHVDGKVAGRMRHGLNESAQQAVRAAEIIRHMREFVARGETDRRPEDIRSVIKEASALALAGSSIRGIRPVFEFAPGVNAVLADRVQIQQVLVNLMRNASEAMRESRERRLVVRTLAQPDNRVAVEVCDTGPGIAPEMEERLFQPFVTSKPGGMGIGLLISKRIIEAHGGQINFRNGHNGGAVFQFTLMSAEAYENAR
jgi:two-component system sensor kinase FixL